MTKKFEIDSLEERIAPSTLDIGTILDHAVSGNAIASGNNVGVSAGNNNVSVNPTINPTTNVNPSTMVSNILNNVAGDLGGSGGSGGGLLGL
jgi:hypothetical protein